MELTERCYSILVVSASAKFEQSITPLLPESLFSPVAFAANSGMAKRKLLERSSDIVIINTPLPDDFGTRLALDICSGSGAGVLMLIKNEHFHDIAAKVTPHGVLAIPKPTSAQMITQSLNLLCGTRERIRLMEQKTATIEEKMEEIRIVNRAKWVLIDHLKMSEAEAHKYIEKQAMDRCVTKRSVAEDIITTYK